MRATVMCSGGGGSSGPGEYKTQPLQTKILPDGTRVPLNYKGKKEDIRAGKTNAQTGGLLFSGGGGSLQDESSPPTYDSNDYSR